MARSEYIYLVRSDSLLTDAVPVAAFTVKRELRAWLSRRPKPGVNRGTMTCESCKKDITPRENKRNAGLCDSCLQSVLRAVAKRLANREKEGK